jgi:predicted phosphodiesterase
VKITFCSDLHLELGDFSLIESPDADVLILAGDIFVATELLFLTDNSHQISSWALDRVYRYFNFITKCCNLYQHVIFVIGNHEHYHGEFNKTESIIKSAFKDFHNLYFLEKNSITINDVLFVGGTLWTDFNKNHLESIETAHEIMNDYQNILFQDEIGIRNFEPEDGINAHIETLGFIEDFVKHNQQKDIVVVTHHAPSKNSIHPRFSADNLLNYAYQSDLDSFIMNNPKIKFWIHGHTHKKQDYKIGNTRILCNPRGYLGREPSALNFTWSVIDI